MSAISRPWTWRVFLTCWLIYTAFWTPYIVREHVPAITLAESGTLNVERYDGWLDDIFRGPKGGAFINNNPGASIAGAIPLILLRPLLARVDEWNQSLPRAAAHAAPEEEFFGRALASGRAYYFLLIAFLTVALVMAPATAGTAAYLCSRLARAGVPPPSAAIAALAYALGTPVFFRTGQLNHNLLVCDAAFTALLLLWDPQDRPTSVAHAALAGLLAGYSFLCDFSAGVCIAVIAIYLWLRSSRAIGLPACRSAAGGGARRGNLLLYTLCVLPGVSALAIYQAWAFGSPFHPSQHYMTPTAPTALGYRGITWPSPALAWANFVDPRFGLFAYCPALLLAFAAPFLRHVRYRLPRREMWLLFVYFALFVLFCAANQYSWLQPLTGFRYLVPIVPGLALLAIQSAQALPKALGLSIAIASFAQELGVVAGHQNQIGLSMPSLWSRHFQLPWMLRLAEAGVHLTWAWPLILILFLAAALAWIWLTVPHPAGQHTRAGSAD
jgi:hypothetical protein